jgi:predicted nuclease of predicted toxin-antitoxin system
MKILIDMNFSPAWEKFLNEEGFEAIHWSNIGKGNDPDSQIFDYARKNDYIILTHDLDFGAMLAHSNEDGPSVIQARIENIIPEFYGKELLSILKQTESFLNEGALVVIDGVRHRIRILPLKK